MFKMFNTKARQEAKQELEEKKIKIQKEKDVKWREKKGIELRTRIDEALELFKDDTYIFEVLNNKKYHVNGGRELTDMVKLYIKNGFIIVKHSNPCYGDGPFGYEHIDYKKPTSEYMLQRISIEYYKKLIDNK